MQSFADVLKNFACFTVHRETPVLESLLMNLQALGPVTLFKKKNSNTGAFLWNSQSFYTFFYRTPPVTASVVFQNNLIFSVIIITLGYIRKLSWKYCDYYHPTLIKISISYQKNGSYAIQKLCCLSRKSPNFMTLSSICFCIIEIFFRGSGVSHSNTVHLRVSLSKIECPIYQEENSPLSQKCS